MGRKICTASSRTKAFAGHHEFEVCEEVCPTLYCTDACGFKWISCNARCASSRRLSDLVYKRYTLSFGSGYSGSDLIWKCNINWRSLKISGRLHSPLKWNSLCNWNFDVVMNCPQIRLVRDHVTLLTDLGKDWASGPLHDFHRWIPIIYSIQIDFRDYALQLFLNDHNIIDYPQRIEENGEWWALRVNIALYKDTS